MIWPAIIAGAASLYGANQAKKSNQASIDAMSQIANRPQRTQLGSFSNPGGISGLAPSIQDRRAGIFSRLPGYRSTLGDAYNTFGGNVAGARSELVGNESAFLQSALNPLRQGKFEAVDAIRRDAGRRGIGGSSLMTTQMGNVGSLYDRQITDATAQIKDQQIGRRLGLDETALNASTSMVNNFGQLDAAEQGLLAQQASEQLNLLGLTQQQVGALMQPLALQMQNNQNFWNSIGRTAMGVGGALGQSTNTWNPFSNLFVNSGQVAAGSTQGV